jgi:hypothetical protein
MSKLKNEESRLIDCGRVIIKVTNQAIDEVYLVEIYKSEQNDFFKIDQSVLDILIKGLSDLNVE